MAATVYAVCNQKGGCAKTVTSVNFGIGLARMGKKVLLIDMDAQGSMTASLGYQQPDRLEITLATILSFIMVLVRKWVGGYIPQSGHPVFMRFVNGQF